MIRALILLLAVCCFASAQSPSVLLFGARSDPFALPAGIGYRWEYTNLTDGAVSSWVDAVAGNTWVQATGLAQPTKDADGVTFSLGKWLDATNTLNCGGPDLDVYLAIIKLSTTSEQYLLAAGNTAWMGISGGHIFYNQATPFGSPGTGYFIDYIYAGKDGSNYKHYTNGAVALSSVNGNEQAGAVQYIGKITLGAPFTGVLKDLIVWTNVVGFDAATVAQIHRYVTNRYAFSP